MPGEEPCQGYHDSKVLVSTQALAIPGPGLTNAVCLHSLHCEMTTADDGDTSMSMSDLMAAKSGDGAPTKVAFDIYFAFS